MLFSNINLRHSVLGSLQELAFKLELLLKYLKKSLWAVKCRACVSAIRIFCRGKIGLKIWPLSISGNLRSTQAILGV